MSSSYSKATGGDEAGYNYCPDILASILSRSDGQSISEDTKAPPFNTLLNICDRSTLASRVSLLQPSPRQSSYPTMPVQRPVPQSPDEVVNLLCTAELPYFQFFDDSFSSLATGPCQDSVGNETEWSQALRECHNTAASFSHIGPGSLLPGPSIQNDYEREFQMNLPDELPTLQELQLKQFQSLVKDIYASMLLY